MMRLIILTMISFVISLNAYASSPKLKPVMSQKTKARAIQAAPEKNLQIIIAKPDLFVKSFDVLPDPAKSGDTCHYYLVVGNKGANPSKKDLWAGISFTSQPGYMPIRVVAPAPGQTSFCEGDLKIPVDFKGIGAFKVFLDTKKELAEIDENNNKGSDAIIVESCAEIGFCKISGSYACSNLGVVGKAGKKLFVGADIYNYGTAATGEGRTLSIGIPGEWPIVVDIPSIEPKKFWAYGKFYTFETPGIRNAKIMINNYNHSDSNLDNNSVNYKINVLP